MHRIQMMTYSELVKTLMIDPIEVADELWVFKIEIFKSQKGYFASLWRYDFYNIPPTFPIKEGWIASESFLLMTVIKLMGWACVAMT